MTKGRKLGIILLCQMRHTSGVVNIQKERKAARECMKEHLKTHQSWLPTTRISGDQTENRGPLVQCFEKGCKDNGVAPSYKEDCFRALPDAGVSEHGSGRAG